jgi:hypothetical protein
MRERLTIAWFVFVVGMVWLALAAFVPSEPLISWGIGFVFVVTGAVALYVTVQRVSRAADVRRHLEMIEAMREGLYK